MDIEFEAKFSKIDKNKLRKKLKNIGANLVRPEFLQKRVVFFLPEGHEIEGGWLRIRDEGDKTTMSLKVVNGVGIRDQKERTLVVADFEKARKFLTSIGCREKSFQENKRELWQLNDTEITLDEWPFLEPFVEVEGPSEERVREVSERLGFNWQEAVFGAADVLVHQKYGIPPKVVNDETPKILFGGENPWTAWLEKSKK